MYVKVIESGCPICGGDVKGNASAGYVCLGCRMLFNRLTLASKKIKQVIK